MARSPRPSRNPRNPSGRGPTVRDPDILLRILLGMIANQQGYFPDHHDVTATMALHEMTAALLSEFAASIVRNGMPKRDTLLQACRELLAASAKPSTD